MLDRPAQLDRLDDRFALLVSGDRTAPSRQRSLAATVEWSYQLLDETQRRVFRALSVFPAGFTLEAAEAVAGEGAGLAVLHLVDCSLLVPPRPGPDGRSRYSILETLRAYANRLLVEAGEQDQAAAALAGHALAVAGQAAAGLRTITGEQDAARWLDAEDATMRQVLAWATERDTAIAPRLADALAPWWMLRSRLADMYPVLHSAAGRAEPDSDRWCTAQLWLGWATTFSGDLTGALGHFTAVRDAVAGRPPSRALADALTGRAQALRLTGRIAEAAADARRALAMARDVGYPAGELLALAELSWEAVVAGDHHDAVRLARQGAQITDGISGQLAMHTGSRNMLLGGLYHCVTLCVATGRHAEALTMRAAHDALAGREAFTDPPWVGAHFEELLRPARQALEPGRARAAEERGAAMSLDTAAQYALTLTEDSDLGQGRPQELGQLSAREQELVILVAQGRTNAQIAAQLYISVRTVSSHLDRIRDKTGCRRRADLTRLALATGLV